MGRRDVARDRGAPAGLFGDAGWKRVELPGDAEGFEGEGGVVFIEELEDVSLLGGLGGAGTDGAARESGEEGRRNPEIKAKRPKVAADEETGTQPRKKKQKRKHPATKVQNGVAAPVPVGPPAGKVARKDTAEDLERSEWAKLGLCLPLVNALQSHGFTSPTRVQTEGIPLALAPGESLIGASETGSGKTLAFGLPMIEALLRPRGDAPPAEKGACPRGLVLAPTRELALQVCQELKRFAAPLGINVVAVVGGMSQDKQHRLLARRPDIVVGTPGRLWEMVESREHIPRVDLEFLVVDEADRMVEYGHFAELTYIFERVRHDSGEGLQKLRTFVFSATLTLPPDFHQKFKNSAKKKRPRVQSVQGLLGQVPFSKKPKVVDLTTERKTASGLLEAVVPCASTDLMEATLYYILASSEGRTLVFCNAISSIRRLQSLLRLLGLPVCALHAQQQQRQRLKSLDSFKQGKSSIMLATDVAARGIDIRSVRCVIQYHIPEKPDTYIHRSGRTARAGKDGVSILLVGPKDASKYHALCKKLKRESLLPEFPVEASLVPQALKRVLKASAIDDIVRTRKKKVVEKAWMEKNAEAAGIALDDDPEESSDDELSHKTSMQCKKLQDELNKMLADPLQKVLDRRFMAGGVNSKEALQKLQKLQQNRSNHRRREGGAFIVGREGSEAVHTLRSALKKQGRAEDA